MKRLYLIRGLPGSGKSTLAFELGGENYEADQFFYKDGIYVFDKDKIGEAHALCRENCERAMEAGVPKISIANTFVRRWELKPYYQLAIDYDYLTTEITITGDLHGNEHDVPDEVIDRMRENWEK